MADIIDGPFQTTLPLPPEKVLRAATEVELECVLVIGREKNGDFYMAGSHSDIAENNLMLDEAKADLIATSLEHNTNHQKR